ncbi:hypothetical protein RhiirA5_504188 [Rhizophagus irregularis]|uniref:Uncharacterized protein n=1 Tax=Rhizophagus irregularis TaxID=588596 RepID=A0A2N0P5S2_9GLOM|nr:hypothetical protein RhiirA5_504188 [Rhizophagus irregularis]
MQSELYVIKLLTDNDEIKAENAKVKAENAKLRQAMEKNEGRLAKLEQSDKEKATFGLKYIGENMAFNCVKETTPGTGLWAKGNAGRNYKSTTETMLKVIGLLSKVRAWKKRNSYMHSVVVPEITLHNDSRQFLRFLDDSWTIRSRFLDDSWTWSAFEQFCGETSIMIHRFFIKWCDNGAIRQN